MFSMIMSSAESISISRCVRRSVSVCRSPSNFFHYNSYAIARIGTKIGMRVDINVGYHLLEGQGHGVKGQGQIDDFVENLFGL